MFKYALIILPAIAIELAFSYLVISYTYLLVAAFQVSKHPPWGTDSGRFPTKARERLQAPYVYRFWSTLASWSSHTWLIHLTNASNGLLMLDPCLLLESVSLWSLRHVAMDSLWYGQRIYLSHWPQLHPGLHDPQIPLALWNLEPSGKPTKKSKKE